MDQFYNLSDNQLAFLAQCGDKLAEEYLAERYMRLVKSCARPLFLAGGDSEDLIQEGTFGLLSSIRQFDESRNCSFKSFAEFCIKNRLLSAVKSASRLKNFPLNDGVPLEQLSDDSSAYLSAFPEVFWRNPEDLVLAKESKEELYSSFTRFLSKFENDVLSYYLSGYSYEEIAQRLNKEAKSVDNAVQRIRRKLAQNLFLGDTSES